MNRANIILLRLAAAVYPALLAGVIVILTRPHPLPKLIGFLSGGLAISIGAGIAIVKRLVATGALTRSSHSSRPIADSVEIAIGAASLLIAWAIWTGHIKRNPFRRKQPAPNQANKPNIAIRALSRGSVAMALAAGMLLNLPGAGYLAALTEIARARPSTAQALAAIVVFNLIMFALAELAIIAYVGEPPRATERVNTLSSLAHQHSRPIWVRIVKLVLGVLFLLLAAKQWRGRLRGGREPKLPRWMKTVGCVTPLGSAGLGIALSAANPKNLLLAAVAAASAIAQTGTRAVDQAVALLVLIVIGTIGIGAPLAIYLPDGPARDEIS